ncbi:hypothetical protein F4780DRAFT_59145 [Xylariomycetidae sp. FL0641]|nr:hypothetical protein F4780DRAFT_59145 [Xylariomycetidae sp. FL0641]
MRFFTAAAAVLSATGALARPSLRRDYTELIKVSDFNAHEALSVAPNGTQLATVDYVSFTLSGEDATGLSCEAETGVPSEVVTCGDSKYRFAVYPGSSSGNFALRLYHELGVGVGYYGEGMVPVYCHAGGGNALTCGQVISPVNITIDSLPGKH